MNRNVGLDILRVYAIISVVYGHGRYIVKDVIPEGIYAFAKLDNVTMFFVLSGYLVGLRVYGWLERGVLGDVNGIKRFWYRRIIRTGPLYFLLVGIMGFWFYEGNQAFPERYSSYFFFSQSLMMPHPDFYRELWSIAAQEWFYFLFPLYIYSCTLMGRLRSPRLYIGLVLLVLVLVTLWRLDQAYQNGYDSVWEWSLNLRMRTISRMDSFMYGVVAAYIHIRHPVYWKSRDRLKFFAGLSLVLLDKVLVDGVDIGIFYFNYVRLTLVPLGVALMLPWLTRIECTSGRVRKFVLFVGSISYAIYLLHLTPIQLFIMPQFVSFMISKYPSIAAGKVVLSYLMYWVMSIIVSYWVYRFVQVPVTRFMEKSYRLGKVA